MDQLAECPLQLFSRRFVSYRLPFSLIPAKCLLALVGNARLRFHLFPLLRLR